MRQARFGETPWRGDIEQDAHVRHYRVAFHLRQLERRKKDLTPDSKLHRDLDEKTSRQLSAIIHAFDEDFRCLADKPDEE